MKQFYEVYAGQTKLATLLRVLSWTHNLMILGQSKRPEEREFYLRLAVRAKWSKRELERQIQSAAFERTKLSLKKLATALRVLPQDATSVFKDSYLLDFLDLPERHLGHPSSMVVRTSPGTWATRRCSRPWRRPCAGSRTAEGRGCKF
jgi:hypothetical protein